jgi:hypothetical protein
MQSGSILPRDKSRAVAGNIYHAKGVATLNFISRGSEGQSVLQLLKHKKTPRGECGVLG